MDWREHWRKTTRALEEKKSGHPQQDGPDRDVCCKDPRDVRGDHGPVTPCTCQLVTNPSSAATQQREDAASRRRAYHSHDEGLSTSQSSSVGHRTGRPVGDQFDSLISNVKENPRRSSENEQIRILLERQREQILADCQDSKTRIPGR